MCDEKTLREVFKEFDADGSGSIDLKELKAVLKAYFDAVKEPADEKKVDELAKVCMRSSVYTEIQETMSTIAVYSMHEIK